MRDLMKYMLPTVALLFMACADAQFIRNVDEHGNVTYSDDPQYDYSQDELDDSQIKNELERIDEYLRERDEAARREQAKKKSRKSKISIERDPLGINQRIRNRKCRFLWSRGLKCL